MNENIITVNNEALSRAMIAVVGAERAKLITEAYQAIDSAMLYGHIAGFKEGYQAAEAAAQADANAAFDHGFQGGQALADAENGQNAYDDGYVDGVSDARACPEEADKNVSRLCGYDAYDDEAETFDNYDDFADAYQGDSGDEADLPLTVIR